MTNKFTPPTTFPHECETVDGHKVTLYALDDYGAYAAMITLVNGMREVWEMSPHQLCDLPTITSHWANDYGTFTGKWHNSRAEADEHSEIGRIAVIRRDTINGVVTHHTEPLT